MTRKCNGSAYAGTILAAAILFLTISFQPTFAAEPINIGLTTDFSGMASTYAVQEAPVIEWVVKEVNAAGGINGRPINLIIQDNGSDPAKAVGNVKMFKEQYHCKAIIMGVTSTVGVALKAWGEKNHLPIITMDSASDRLWDKTGESWFFRTEVPTSLRILAALDRMKKLGYTKVAFEGSTLAWGTDALTVVKERASDYGITLVAVSLIEPKTKDLTIQAKQLKDSGAQAVICAEYEAEGGVFARAMKQIEWNPYVFHVSAANYVNTLEMYPPELFEGWETVMTIDRTKPLVRKIWEKTKAYTGKNPIEDEKCPRSYDAINLLIEALKASGNPEDSTAIRDAFYKLSNYERATGKQGGKGGFGVGRNHLLDISDLVSYTTKAGKLVPVK